MFPQTQEVTEALRTVARLDPASQTTVQTSARVKASLYNRFLAVLDVGVLASNTVLNMAINQHNAASGGTSKAVSGKAITALTQAGSDSNKMVGIELRSEELDGDNGFDWISVAVTTSVGAAIFGMQLYATSARYAPIGTDEWDEVVH